MRKTAKKASAGRQKPKSETLPGKVRVSEVKHPHHTHIVYFPANGKRAFKWFNNHTEAMTWAKAKSAEAGAVGADFGSISEPERAAIAHWRSFVASVPDCPPPALLNILQEYSKRHKAIKSSVTVAAAVEAYEAAKSAEGLRGVSLAAIHARCSRFVADFGERPIASISAPEISDWILSLAAVKQPVVKRKGAKYAPAAQVSLLTKRNHRLALSGLFNYAKGRGWVSENPVAESAKPRPPRNRPGILRAAEVSRFFHALEKAAPALVPFWAVRFFAGIREQECLRMDWSMIDLAAGEINLADGVTKNGHSRTVKIEPALAAFLTPHQQPDGRIVTSSAMGRIYWTKKALRLLQAEDEAAAALAKRDGSEPPRPFPVPMPDNAARHSFATFHLLAFRHAGETAIQLGHGQSPELLHRHYKGIATEAEGKAFWEIRPAAGPSNVVPMTASPADAAPAKLQARRNAK